MKEMSTLLISVIRYHPVYFSLCQNILHLNSFRRKCFIILLLMCEYLSWLSSLLWERYASCHIPTKYVSRKKIERTTPCIPMREGYQKFLLMGNLFEYLSSCFSLKDTSYNIFLTSVLPYTAKGSLERSKYYCEIFPSISL